MVSYQTPFEASIALWPEILIPDTGSHTCVCMLKTPFYTTAALGPLGARAETQVVWSKNIMILATLVHLVFSSVDLTSWVLLHWNCLNFRWSALCPFLSHFKVRTACSVTLNVKLEFVSFHDYRITGQVIYAERNNEARSCNYCCPGNVITIK